MWQPPWGCYSSPDSHQIPILVTFLVNLKGHFMGVATTLMSNLWDTIIHKVFLQDSGLLRTSIVASFKFDYAFRKLYRKSYSHSPCFNSTSRSSSYALCSWSSYATYKSASTCSHLHQSVGSLHPGSCPGPHGMVAHQSHTSPGPRHQPREPPPIHSSAPPIVESTSKLWKDRLDAAFTRKLETMAETFKASWTKPQQSPPPNPILTSSSSASVVPALTLPTPLTPTTLDQPQQAGTGEASIPNPPKLPIKAKPPLPPKLAQSAQVFPLHLDEEDHVHHRMLYLREDLEQDIGQSTRSRSHSHRPTRGSYGEKCSGPRHSHTATSSRQGLPSRTSRPPPSSTRDFARPIYERSTMLRHSSPTTRSGRSRPTYRDVLPTIRINERESRANTGKHHSRNRPDRSATLRLRSRSREHRTKQRNQRGLFEREPGVQIRAKARPTTPAAGSGTP